jgi:hypothetical protein
MKITPPRIAIAVVTLLVGGCSVIVNADRSKVQDDLFHPPAQPEAGAPDAGAPNEGDAAGDGATESDAAATEGGAGDAAAVSDGSASDAAIADAADGG